MPRDDYFRIVYEILKELYIAMKDGEPVDPIKISADSLGINQRYRDNVLGKMLKENLVEGFKIKKYVSGTEISGIENIDITHDGIAFLKNNSEMKKVVNYLMKIGETVPKFIIH